VVRYVNEYGSQTGGPILEVGCAAGYLGEVPRKQGFEVWGVETNAAAVVEASKRLNHVFHDSIEDFLLDPAFAETKFQFVISGDVIEHLVRPVETLLAAIAELEPLLDPTRRPNHPVDRALWRRTSCA
jgi:2-polyprenyl-3-methyl-5-hydroxy-6-metoxy-1,4-benzoquinol methylase